MIVCCALVVKWIDLYYFVQEMHNINLGYLLLTALSHVSILINIIHLLYKYSNILQNVRYIQQDELCLFG